MDNPEPFLIHQPVARLDALRKGQVSLETRLYLVLEHLRSVDPASADGVEAYCRKLQQSVVSSGGTGASIRTTDADQDSTDVPIEMERARTLLARERQAILDGSSTTGKWAEEARQILVGLPGRFRSHDWVSVLSQAHALLGNAYRVAGDLKRASEEFAVVDALLRTEIEVAPVARIEVDDLLGALRRDEREYLTGGWHQERAILTAEATGRADLAARALIGLGITYGYAGKFRMAMQLTQEAARRFTDSAVEIELLVRMNAALFATSGGDLETAENQLARVEQLRTSVRDVATLLRCDWIAARYKSARGKEVDALTLYRAVVTGFINLDRPYDVLLAVLDYALTLRLIPRQDAIRELAREVEEILTKAPVPTKQIHETLRILESGVETSEDFAFLTALRAGIVTGDD